MKVVAVLAWFRGLDSAVGSNGRTDFSQHQIGQKSVSVPYGK